VHDAGSASAVRLWLIASPDRYRQGKGPGDRCRRVRRTRGSALRVRLADMCGQSLHRLRGESRRRQPLPLVRCRPLQAAPCAGSYRCGFARDWSGPRTGTETPGGRALRGCSWCRRPLRRRSPRRPTLRRRGAGSRRRSTGSRVAASTPRYGPRKPSAELEEHRWGRVMRRRWPPSDGHREASPSRRGAVVCGRPGPRRIRRAQPRGTRVDGSQRRGCPQGADNPRPGGRVGCPQIGGSVRGAELGKRLRAESCPQGPGESRRVNQRSIWGQNGLDPNLRIAAPQVGVE